MKKEIIQKTASYVRKTLEGEGTGHDWWHVERVWKNSKLIGAQENADMYVIELAALLHDIADHKFHGGDHSVGPRVSREWLESLGIKEEIIAHVCDIVANISYSSGGKVTTIEGKVVQDADRLDAMGAIGIARTFAYGGHEGREIYNPDNKIHSSVQHFYDKLFKLKDLMNTETGKEIAKKYHKIMEDYLEQFYKEWNVE